MWFVWAVLKGSSASIRRRRDALRPYPRLNVDGALRRKKGVLQQTVCIFSLQQVIQAITARHFRIQQRRFLSRLLKNMSIVMVILQRRKRSASEPPTPDFA
jgi:hypothetical protein